MKKLNKLQIGLNMIISIFEYSSADLYESEFKEMVELFEKKFKTATIESYVTRDDNYIIEIRDEELTPSGLSWIMKSFGIDDLLFLRVNCRN